jgi:hypothetical protein
VRPAFVSSGKEQMLLVNGTEVVRADQLPPSEDPTPYETELVKSSEVGVCQRVRLASDQLGVTESFDSVFTP